MVSMWSARQDAFTDRRIDLISNHFGLTLRDMGSDLHLDLLESTDTSFEVSLPNDDGDDWGLRASLPKIYHDFQITAVALFVRKLFAKKLTM